MLPPFDHWSWLMSQCVWALLPWAIEKPIIQLLQDAAYYSKNYSRIFGPGLLVAVGNNDYAGIRITTSKAAQHMDKPMVLRDRLIELVYLVRALVSSIPVACLSVPSPLINMRGWWHVHVATLYLLTSWLSLILSIVRGWVETLLERYRSHCYRLPCLYST